MAINTTEANNLLRGLLDFFKPQDLSDQDINVLYQQYCNILYKRWEMLDFRGIMHVEMNRPMSLPLTEVFICPDLLVGVPKYETLERDEDIKSDTNKKTEKDWINKQDHLLEERIKKEKEVTLEREELPLVLGKHKRLVILGDPGAGKSTLLRYLLLRLTHEQDKFVQDFPQLTDTISTIPLYMPLAAYAEAWRFNSPGERSLEDFIPKYLRENYPQISIAFVQKQLERGQVLFLFDGLDEIPDASLRNQIVKQIEVFTQAYGRNRFIVSSRIVGYKEAPLSPDYQPYTIAQFNEKQIKLFAQKWCPAYELWVRGTRAIQNLEQEAEKLFQATQDNEGVKKLAANPLLLTILALIQRQGIELPNHRIKLFDLCVTTLIDTWVKAKGQHLDFDEDEMFEMLRSLAFWMHERSAIGVIREDDLIARIVTQLSEYNINEYEAKKIARQFLSAVRGKAGILIERGEERYGFLHQTFEEYFSARELVIRKKERNNFIKRNLHNPRWREVILLALGTIGILQKDKDEATEIVHDVILKAESPFENWLHRDLLFAGFCLADDIRLNAIREDEIIEQIIYLYLTCPFNLIRQTLSMVLKAWRGTRAGKKASYILLSLFNILEKISEDTVSDSVSSIQKKFADYYRYFLQEDQRASITLVHFQIWFILWHLLTENEEPGAEHLDLELYTPSSYDVRQAAVSGLGSLATQVAQMYEILLEALSDANDDVRQAAVSALGPLATQVAEVREALLKALSDSTPTVRQAAVSGLGSLAAQDREVREALLKALSDANDSVRQAAVTGLGPLATQDREVREALLKALSDYSDVVRQAAVSGLGSLATQDAQMYEILLEALSNANDDVRQAAVSALGPLATQVAEVREALLKALSDSSWIVQQTAVSALGSLAAQDREVREALLKALSDSFWIVQRAAVTALGPLAAQDREVREALLKAFSDANDDVNDDVRRAAVTGLGPLAAQDAEVREILFKALSDPEDMVRQTAVTGLGPLAAQDAEVREALLKALPDSSPIVRQTAVTALGPLAAQDREVREVLLKALSDSSPIVRQEVVTALIKIGEKDFQIKEYLLTILSNNSTSILSSKGIDDIKIELYTNIIIRLLNQVELIGVSHLEMCKILIKIISNADKRYKTDVGVQQIASSALAQSKVDEPEVREALLKALSDANDSVRQTALSALGPLATQDREVREALLKALSDANDSVRQTALSALGSLATQDREVREALLKALSDANDSVRQAAVTGLGPLASQDREVREALLKALSGPSLIVRQTAVTALDPLAAQDAEVREALLKALSDPSPIVQQAAVTALAQSSVGELEVREALLKALSDANDSVRQAAVTALDPLAAQDAEVREALLKALSDANDSVRQAAAMTLGRLGVDRSEIYEILLKPLSDPSWTVRYNGIRNLSSLTIYQYKISEALLKALSDIDEYVRKEAATALGTLRIDLPEVREALLKALSDSSQDVRKNAATALAAIWPTDRAFIGNYIEKLLKINQQMIISQFQTNTYINSLLEALEIVISEI